MFESMIEVVLERTHKRYIFKFLHLKGISMCQMSFFTDKLKLDKKDIDTEGNNNILVLSLKKAMTKIIISPRLVAASTTYLTLKTKCTVVNIKNAFCIK